MNCLYCDQTISTSLTWQSLFHRVDQPLLCHLCIKKLHLLVEPLCKRCSRPLNQLNTAFVVDNICYDCVQWEQRFGFVVAHQSVYLYNDFLKDIFALYKFRGDYIFSRFFSSMLKGKIDKTDVDLIIPLPISEARKKERGFNQVEAIVDNANIAYSKTLQVHDRTEKQSHKNRKERLATENHFFVENKAKITHKNILLIDDIYTTGTTIYHATHVLKQAGAKHITSFSIARG